MFLDFFFIVATLGIFFFPVLTGYIAYSHGRSFWRWLGLGLMLPFFSVFVALFVAMRDQWAEERAAEAATKRAALANTADSPLA